MIAGLLALLAVINSAYAPVSYSCNGSTAAFTVNFPYLAQTDLVVTTTTGAGASTTLVLTTDYSLSVTSTQSTATLTLNSPSTKCPTGNTLKIARNTSPTQPTSFKSQINFSPSLHETAFDRITMITQERSATAGSVLDSYLANPYSGVGACSANTWASVLSRNTAPTCTQPNFSNLAGTASTAQVPSLDASKITTGILPQSLGGTGAGALTCTGAAVTSNGTAYSCSPAFGLLNSTNNWTSAQTFNTVFAASGVTSGVVIGALSLGVGSTAVRGLTSPSVNGSFGGDFEGQFGSAAGLLASGSSVGNSVGDAIGGGAGLVARGGLSSGTNSNGEAIYATSGSGGSGTASGYVMRLVQNNSIKPHAFLSPSSADPSSPDPGGIWTLENGTDATALKFRSTGIGAVTPKTYIMAPLVAATISFTSTTTVTLPSANMTCVCSPGSAGSLCTTSVSGTTLTLVHTGSLSENYICFMTQ